MIYRLQFLDVNKPDDELHQLDLVEFEMQLPDLTTYKDLHAGMNVPKMTVQRLASFLAPYTKALDYKCKQLYRER